MHTRREFLKMGSVAAIGAGLLGVVVRPAKAAPETAESLGIAPSNTAAANRAALITACNNTSKHIVFGNTPGDYQFQNNTPIVIQNFSGTIEFVTGTTTCWQFTNNTVKAINFNGGTGLHLWKVRTKYTTLPPSRVNAQECVHISNATDPLAQGLIIQGSAAAGLLFGNCIRPVAQDVVVVDTRADGVHFANCQAASATTINVTRPGDDGVAFVNYGSTNFGGTASGITVTDGDTRGITVVGQQDVEISDFTVNRTYSSGIYVACEGGSYPSMPQPKNVTVRDGEVIGAGLLLKGGVSGPNPDSIFYHDCHSAIAFTNITSRCPVRDHVRYGGIGTTSTLTNIQQFAAC